jgi:K+-sensing histidine kinase KdpD
VEKSDIISILCDNIWKYSVNNSEPEIIAEKNEEDDITLCFVNNSLLSCETDKIFERGYQHDDQSEGFGYGLYWAGILIDHYNELSGRSEGLLELKHNQLSSNNTYEQIFTLENIRI